MAFKPNTDDIREAPALYLIEKLLEAGCEVSAYDPEAEDNTRAIFGDRVEFAPDQYSAVKHADFLIIVTEWSAFRTPDFEKMSNLLRSKVIFDGRNLYSPDQMRDHGFIYISIGRQS